MISGDSTATRWAILCLLLTAVVAFGASMDYGFVWDDHEQVVDNVELRSWSNLGRFWTSDVLGTTRESGERSNYYRPLFFVENLVMYQLFGLNTVAWHLVAIALHLLASATAWLLLRQLGFQPRVAFFATLLFLAHPIHTESVSWIAAAYNGPPAAILVMLALAGYIHWRRRSKAWALTGSCLAFAAALCIKESALSFLLLVPLVEAHALGERPWRKVLLPYGALLGMLGFGLLAEVGGLLPAAWPPGAVFVFQAFLCAAGVALFARQQPLAARTSWSLYLGLTLGYLLARRVLIGTTLGIYGVSTTWQAFLSTQPLLLLHYLRFIVWPWGLSPSYPLRYVTAETSLVAGLALLAVLAVAYLAWRLARRHRTVALGVAWLAACLLPALNTLAFREAYLVHHRYLYLGILGPCVILAWALLSRPWPPAVKTGLAGSTVVVLALASAQQNHYWRSDRDLWLRVAEVDSANAAALDWLGHDARARRDINEAESWMRRSVSVAPEAGRGAYNLGSLLQDERRDPAAALVWYKTAMDRFDRGHPEENELYLRSAGNYALALAQTGERTAAITMLSELAGPPHLRPDAARNAAVLLVESGDVERAARIISTALAAHPENEVLATMKRDLIALAGKAPQ